MKYFVTSKLSENIAETPEGFLLCTGVPIARTGEMIYGQGESPIKVGPDGRAIVTREAKEVFRPETIASFEGKPFTITHPDDFVDPSNWRFLAKGVLQNVRRGAGEFENDLIADILVTDEEAIKLVRAGVREVSCGYECEYIELGVGRGMQTNIIGNHLALVEQGRAGAAYAINDQKGAKMKLSEKIRKIWSTAADEAAKVVDEADGKDKKEDPPGEKAPAWAERLEKVLTKVADALTVGSPSGPTPSVADEEKEEKKEDKPKDAVGEEKEEKSEDEEKPEEKKDKSEDATEARFKKIEDAMTKLCDALDIPYGDEAAEGEEESEDGAEEEEDDDFEETPAGQQGAMDEKSRIEILAPGLKAKGKDAKRQALMEAYKAKDSKAIIDRLAGGKAIDLKKAPQKTIDHLFVGASEVIGLYRTKDFTKWKQVRDSQTSDDGAGQPMTAEMINEKNAKHYAEKGVH